MEYLETIELPSSQVNEKTLLALENGKVIFIPKASFSLLEAERRYLSPLIVAPKSKNVSYDMKQDRVGGTIFEGKEKEELRNMMKRYASYSRSLLDSLFPHYSPSLVSGRTSFRPIEAQGRVLSKRKDDTRLHIDAFPSSPIKGKRILRVFTNVNPEGRPRVWKLGEPFKNVVEKMAPQVKKPLPFSSYFLEKFGITKERRSLYDHYMLQIHDRMKEDNTYQKEVMQKEVHFPAGSTWIVYSDQVSHAALSGQHLFEQTFYLPVAGMKDEKTSPLRVLESFFQSKMTG